ncbi:cyclin-domain-containing protein, partial [Melanomma pulvis-pyrius CBS 109.77]
MLTSSPTISAPSSPSAAFHAHARPYHASRRTSASSCAHSNSPRFLPQVSGASRRLDTPLHPPSATSTQSPVPAFTRSPQIRKREYADAGTQYTPPDYPPTYRPPVPAPAPLVAPATIPETPIADVKQGEPSAAPVVTEPPEPELRIDPQPVVPLQQRVLSDTVPSRGIEAQNGDGQQTAEQTEASTVAQVQSSPAKRARPQDPNVKLMPLKYEMCDVKDLGVLISDMLMELVRLNDGFPLRDGQLTRFHSRAPPGISVRDYLFRLIVHATLSPPILLSMVFYVDKLCTMYPAFTISSLTVHRFLITAATVAAKGLSDSFWTNSLYARVGGVSLRELALLELEFLRKLDWRIVPKPETLVDYYKGLVERGEGYTMEKEKPESAPAASSVQI